MDVTNIVNQRLREEYIDRMPELLDKLDDQVCGADVDWDALGATVPSRQEEEDREGSQQWNPTTWRDLQLAIGAKLAAQIRQEIFDTLNYTCSAGVAHYKVVAKLCSSKNKPNKQTVLRECARLDFMRDVPFNKIRNMGGKLGSEVGSGLEILTAGEIWKHDVVDLQDIYGKSTGLYIYNICRGIDDEEGL
jgi:DNA polymerase eta